jgi:DNA processing protein
MRQLIDALGAPATLAAIRSPHPPQPADLAAQAANDPANGEAPPGAPATEPRTPEGEAVARITRSLARWRTRLAGIDPPRVLDACAATGGRFVIPGDAEWPTQLDDLAAARPYGLWLRGNGNLRFACLRSAALVGSRAATDYGMHVAVEIAGDLAERGWTVVSGGAFGVDARAHRGALAEHGRTIAVLACGTDVAYPASHTGLFEEITETGVIVSEWPPGARPYRGRFLVRNRVIAALTRGTVVVEAAPRSGALSTARHARDLSRHVMAVPGPITSETSRGCHRILREWNAICVTSADEVIEQIGLIGDDLATPQRPPVLPRDRLDPDTLRVLDAIPARAPGAGPATVAAESGIELDTTIACLGHLAAGGFIEHTPTGWHLRQGTAEPGEGRRS